MQLATTTPPTNSESQYPCHYVNHMLTPCLSTCKMCFYYIIFKAFSVEVKRAKTTFVYTTVTEITANI